MKYMRDLACCANGMAFYSTPSDLVRFALATDPESVNGQLAGGMVMSLMMRRDGGIVRLAAPDRMGQTRAPRGRVACLYARRMLCPALGSGSRY